MRSISLTLFAALIVFTALNATLAHAQQVRVPAADEMGWSFGIRPQLVNLEGVPGSSHTFNLFVHNADPTRSARAWLWIADPVQRPNGSLSFEPVGSYEYSSGNWITLGQNEVIIPPNSEVAVNVTMRIPGGGLAGSYHSLIAVSGTPPPGTPIAPERENEAFVVNRVTFGVIIHTDITGTLRPDAEVETMFISTDPPPRSGMTPRTAPAKRWLVIRLRNTGNSMIYGWGWAMLRREGAGLVHRWRVGHRDVGERRVIYPGRHIDLYLPIERQLTAGRYVASTRLDYAPRRAALGDMIIDVTEDQARDDIVTTAGPFESLTLGLSVLVDKELEELAVTPGGLRTGILTITNNEDTDLQVELELSNAAMDADGIITPGQYSEKHPVDVAQWLRVGPMKFNLPPGVGRRIQYIVEPPDVEDLRQDLVGLIRVRARRLDAVAREAEQEVIGETGTLIVASMAGRGERVGEIGEIKVDVRPELSGLVRFGIPIINSGDVHFFPIVRLVLQGKDNPSIRLEAKAGLGDSRTLVLPGIERIVWIEARRSVLEGGLYTASISLDYGGTAPVTRSFGIQLQDVEAAAGEDGEEAGQPQPEVTIEPGEPAAELEMLQVDTTGRLTAPIRIGVPVKNTGETELLPRVGLTLEREGDEQFRWSGETAATQDRPILPETTGVLWLEVPRQLLEDGSYFATVTVNYGGQAGITKRYQLKFRDLNQPGVDASAPGQGKPRERLLSMFSNDGLLTGVGTGMPQISDVNGESSIC
jgi:hypothetical protein